jgi:hypothetical protein
MKAEPTRGLAHFRGELHPSCAATHDADVEIGLFGAERAGFETQAQVQQLNLQPPRLRGGVEKPAILGDPFAAKVV